MSYREHDGEDKNRFNWIPGIIRHDFVRKFIALFFACLVYFTVSIKVGEVTNIQGVAVRISLPQGLVDKDTEVKKVRVTLRGSKRALSSVTASDIKIKLDVAMDKFVPSMPYTIKINANDIRTPIGTRVAGITPSFLTLNLEEEESKEVPIQAKFDSLRKLPSDLKVDKVKLTPSVATLTGPKSLIEEIDKVSTVPIPVDSTTLDSFEYQVKLTAIPGAKIIPGEAKAQVEIVKEFTSKAFKSIPIKVLGNSQGQRFRVELLTSPHAEVTLAGPKGAIAEFKSEKIKPYIDISGFDKPGTYMADIRCWVDDQGVKVTGIYPKQVQIKITKE